MGTRKDKAPRRLEARRSLGQTGLLSRGCSVRLEQIHLNSRLALSALRLALRPLPRYRLILNWKLSPTRSFWPWRQACWVAGCSVRFDQKSILRPHF